MELCGDCGGFQRAAALLRQEQCAVRGKRLLVDAAAGFRRRGSVARTAAALTEREGCGAAAGGGHRVNSDRFVGMTASLRRRWLVGGSRLADPASLREGDSFHARHRKRGDLVLGEGIIADWPAGAYI